MLPIVWLAWLALVSRRHVVRGGGVVLIAALTIVPWMLRNATVFGRFIPISANGFSNIAGYYVMRGYEISYTGPPLPEQYDEYGAANPFAYWAMQHLKIILVIWYLAIVGYARRTALLHGGPRFYICGVRSFQPMSIPSRCGSPPLARICLC